MRQAEFFCEKTLDRWVFLFFLYLNAVSSLDAFGPLAVVLAFQPLVHLRLIFRQLSDLLCRLGKITFWVSFDF
jgi:hypothetical protein